MMKSKIYFNKYFLFFFILISVFQQAKADLLITVFGDSLVSGYGLLKEESFPEVLRQKLLDFEIKAQINNAGVSGDTSSGGLARFDWVISEKPDILIIVLGSNDMLRGINPEITQENLSKIIEKSKEKNIQVLLCGMQSGGNMGVKYKENFDSIYSSLKNKHEVFFYPFFLEGVALNPIYNQKDLMHPNKQGIHLIVNKMIPSILEVIEEVNNKP